MSNDILVLMELSGDRIADVAYEILGKGRELATAAGGRLVAVLLGARAAALAPHLGIADAVLAVSDPALDGYSPDAHAAALGAVVRDRQPRAVLIGHTSTGMDLAPAVAAAANMDLAAYCKGISLQDGGLVAISQIYGGKVLAEVDCPGPTVFTVLPGSFPAASGQGAGSPAVETVAGAPPAGGMRTRFRRLIEPEAADVDITKEEVLVSIGRGIQSQDNIELAEALAAALGGAVSASRPLIDSGWLPKARQVGKSGLTVKPKLYLAAGISGAPEHVEGMKEAELIIAVNTDPAAPIFEVADYGAVADILDVLPALTERLAAEGLKTA